MAEINVPAEFRISTTVGLSIIIGGLLNTGVMYQQFQQLKADQKTQSVMVSLIRENQINDLANIGNVKNEQFLQSARLERVDKRLLVVEGHLMNGRK